MKHVESASVDEKEDFEAKIDKEAGDSFPVGSSELEVDPCPVAGTKSEKNSDNLHITATKKIGEPQERHSEVDHECTKDSSMATDLCESIEKQGDEVTVSFIKDDKEAVEEHRDKPCSKLSGNLKYILVHSCDFVDVIKLLTSLLIDRALPFSRNTLLSCNHS